MYKLFILDNQTIRMTLKHDIKYFNRI